MFRVAGGAEAHPVKGPNDHELNGLFGAGRLPPADPAVALLLTRASEGAGRPSMATRFAHTSLKLLVFSYK